MKIEIYDPPMCCSTGICGPSVDEKLIRINEDLNKIKQMYPEATVERYMITQQPLKFKENPGVYAIVQAKGKNVLPITTVNGRMIKSYGYPSLDEIVKAIEGDK